MVDTECPGNSRYDLRRTALVESDLYVKCMFILRSVLCVLVPFFVLAVCNVHIVLILRQQQQLEVLEQ